MTTTYRHGAPAKRTTRVFRRAPRATVRALHGVAMLWLLLVGGLLVGGASAADDVASASAAQPAADHCGRSSRQQAGCTTDARVPLPQPSDACTFATAGASAPVLGGGQEDQPPPPGAAEASATRGASASGYGGREVPQPPPPPDAAEEDACVVGPTAVSHPHSNVSSEIQKRPICLLLLTN